MLRKLVGMQLGFYLTVVASYVNRVSMTHECKSYNCIHVIMYTTTPMFVFDNIVRRCSYLTLKYVAN